MKKISLYMMALLTMGLASCSDDYVSTTDPQSNPQEPILQTSDITVNQTTISVIDLTDLKENNNPITLGTVTVKEGAMTSDTELKAVVQVATKADFSDAKELDAEKIDDSNKINILPINLQELYTKFTRNPQTTTLYMRTNLFTVTNGESIACIGDPQTTFFGEYPNITFTPYNEFKVPISNAYYAVIKGLDKKWSVEKKFNHSEEDVYDDPVFTVSIDALKNEAGVRFDTEYYIVAEEDLAAFKAGDLSVGFGKGDGEAIVKGGPAFVGPASDGAAKYNLTLNMEKLTLVIEPEVHFYCYYLYTNSGANMSVVAPETYRNYMFYKVDETTFTYTTFWPNNSAGKSVYNTKVWEREAMLAGATTKTWGFNGTSKGTRVVAGDFAQPGQWLGPLTEGWYTFTITMDEENNKHSYKWTAVDAPSVSYTNISIIGTINGSSWDKDFELTQCAKAPHNWCLLNFELTADAKLKFRANKNWETKDWGGDGSQPISNVVYTLPKGSSDITVPAGKYDFYLNDITGDWTILKAE